MAFLLGARIFIKASATDAIRAAAISLAFANSSSKL
jgi:hypothetical protein